MIFSNHELDAAKVAWKFALPLLALFVAPLTGCSGDEPDPPATAYTCVRDQALLEQRSECRRDHQCPCGAHCANGQCTFECLGDAACDGWCDYQGYCRADDDRSAIAPIQDRTRGRLVVLPKLVLTYKTDFEAPIEIRAEREPLAGIRVKAEPGLLVQCGDSYVTECGLDALSAGESLRIVAKPEAGTLRTDWQLRVFQGAQMEFVRIESRTMTQASRPPPGVYEGQIWIETARAAVQTDEPFSVAPFGSDLLLFDVPVRIDVFDDGTFVLDDGFGALPANWVLQLAANGTLARPANSAARLYFGGAASIDDHGATELAVDVSGRTRLSQDGQAMLGTIDVTLSGLGLGYAPPWGLDERPRVQWRFSATRIGDVSMDAPSPTEDPPTFDDFADRYDHALPWEGAMSACPDLGWSVDAERDEIVEHYLCYQHTLDGQSVGFSDDPGRRTKLGDLGCDRVGSESGAFPIFTSQSNANTMLTACLTDLAKLDDAPSENTCTTDVNTLTGYSADDRPGCINVPLALTAMGLGMQSTQRSPGDVGMVSWELSSETGARLAHRVLQQWIQVHAFVASEAAQANDLTFVQPPDLGLALDRSLRGWDVVLHPRVVGRLLHMPGGILAAPDYRPDGVAGASTDFAQPLGVSVAMAEALAAQVDAATQLTTRAWFDGRDVPPQVERTLRHTFVVMPLAQLVRERARASQDEELTWDDAWWSAKRDLLDRLESLTLALRQHASGANPLGIEDDDLPLYRGSASLDSAARRFSAVSSYLLEDWAAEAVQSAADSYDSGRNAWQALLERQLQKELSLAEATEAHNARLDEINRNVGDKILSLCGNPNNLSPHEVLTQWDDVSAIDCFINKQKRECKFDEADLLGALNAEDIAYQMCLLGGLDEQLGRKMTYGENFSAEAEDWLVRFREAAPTFERGDQWWGLFETVLGSTGEMIVRVKDGEFALEANMRDLMPTSDYATTTNEDMLAVRRVEDQCAGYFPGSVPVGAKMASLEDSPMHRPDCYRGSLGELALAARSAAKDVEAATSRLADHRDAYERQINQCIMITNVAEQKAKLQEHYDELAGQLQEMNGVIGQLGRAANNVWSLIGLSFDAKTDNKGTQKSRSAKVNPGPLVGLLTGGLEQAAYDITVGPLEDVHAEIVAELDAGLENALCFNEAGMELVGVETQLRRVEQSRIDLSQAIVRLRNTQEELGRLIRDGHRRIAKEEGRRTALYVTPLFDDVWDDLWNLEQDVYRGAVEKYRRNFRLAQRTLYLALRGVEYEWQLSHSARSEILEARTPQQLEIILGQLEAEVAAGGINGQTPSQIHVVVSVKDHLLRLADRETWPDGHQTMDDATRFRALLSSPRYARYGNDGRYIGQLIGLSIAPTRIAGLTDVNIPLLAGSDCAERVWSVNAVLQGEGLAEQTSSFTRLELLQRNTFFSQWCIEPASDQANVANASVRPAHNLFKDPVWGGTFGRSAAEESDYVRARILAYHNVSRSELEAQSYEQGATEELATRALYGEYALFFPAESLDVQGSGGLRLYELDDVLLRFDYVSAARRW